MSISFTSAVGNMFNRLGAIFCAWRTVETNQRTTLPQIIDTAIGGQFNGNRPYVPDLIPAETNAQAQAGTAKSNFQTWATTALVEMIHADTPLPAKTLDYALPQLIYDMQSAAAKVNANTVSGVVTASTNNTGTGGCIVSLVDGKGTTLENVYGENIVITCTSDSQPSTGSTVAGSEIFTVRGQNAVAKTDFLWPTGSGGSTTILASNSAVDVSAQNFLTNGDFESFTTNTPDSWTVINGTPGTTIGSTATAYRGSLALSITGNGSQRTRIAQTLRLTSAGTVGSVNPQTRYAFSVRLRRNGSITTGTLRIALRDGTTDGAAVIGGASITVTASGLTTGYVLYTCQFNSSLALPAALYAVVELTAAVDNGSSIYIDDLVMGPMVQHQNGPLFFIIPGATNFIVGDIFTAAITNARDGIFQEMFNRAFNMDGRKIVLPSDAYGAETILDALVSC